MNQIEAEAAIVNWEADLRAELSTWPKEEIINLVVSLALKNSVRKMVMEKKIEPALADEHARRKHLKKLLEKRRSK